MFRKLLGLSLIALAAPALAGDLNYNFAQLKYEEYEIDIVDEAIPSGSSSIDGDGFALTGSFEVGEHWYVLVDYGQTKLDFDVDLSQLALGVNFRVGMTERVDFTGGIAVERLKAEESTLPAVSETGIGANIGIRALLADWLELNGRVGYIEFGDNLSEVSGERYGVGAAFNFSERFGVVLDADYWDDVTAYGVGVRIYW